MSPRRRRREPPRAGTERHRGDASPLREGSAGRRRAAWIGAVLVAACAVAWLLGRPLLQRRAAPAEPEPLASMNARAALRAAVSLGRAGRHLASLPYYRHALRTTRDDFWELHFNFGSALYNATLQLEPRSGLPMSVVRSSWERAALMREAIQQFGAAEALARDPAAIAFVRTSRAHMFWLWGFPWETFAAYREAQFANPADRSLAVQADRFMDLLRSPAASGLPEPAVPGAP
jgi:hypothetical protein